MRNGRIGARSHTGPDLSRESRTASQEFGRKPDVNARIQFFQVGFPHEHIVISLSGLRKFTPSTSASIPHESAGGGRPNCSRKIIVRNVSLHEIMENIRILRIRLVQLFLKPWTYGSRLKWTMYWLSMRQ
jgi:hypothetical protein